VGAQPDRPEKRPPVKTDLTIDATPGLAARKAAARLLAAVVDAKTPLDGLTDHDHGHPQFRALEMRDRALVRAILTTALRFRRTIQALIDARLQRPLPANARSLAHILHVAAAQVLFLDVPDSAAVDLAVTHAKEDTRTARFAALVNGVLREIARRKERALPAALAQTTDAPDWFAASLDAAYGEVLAGDILAAHRVEPAIDLTVKSDAEGWAERLGGVVLPTGSVRLERLPGPLTELPGFAEGEWWVQDAAAALPARLLGDIAGKRVADLCAAPGGKTAQLVHAGAAVTAVEMSPNRAKRLKANLERLKLDAQIVEGDLFAFSPDALVDRHGAPPPRRAVDQGAAGCGKARRPAGAHAWPCRIAGEAGRADRVLQLLSGEGRGRGAYRRLPRRQRGNRRRSGAAGRISVPRSVPDARRLGAHHAGGTAAFHTGAFGPRRLLRRAAAPPGLTAATFHPSANVLTRLS
jgi:16S rRNA (cytosine967-C5)-methyltransferase